MLPINEFLIITCSSITPKYEIEYLLVQRVFRKFGYFPKSLIFCSSSKEQTSSCPFFSATI